MPASSRPFLIGVAGGTCAGKTVLCERLAEQAGEGQVALIRLDMYQIDRSHQIGRSAPRRTTTTPMPTTGRCSTTTWPCWPPARACTSPTYDFTVHNRSEIVRWIAAAPVIIVEGILVLGSQRCANAST